MMDFLALAQQCAPFVAPSTMAAIVKTESRFQPWAIGVNGGARLVRQPANKEEAIATARWLIREGYNIDLGLGQVNVRNLARTGLSIEDAFDGCKNLRAAASILQTNYQSALPLTASPQGAVQKALSLYNTGSMTKGFKNGYVHKVLSNAGFVQNLPDSQAPSKSSVANRQSANVVLSAIYPPAPSIVKKSMDDLDPPSTLELQTHVYEAKIVENILVYGTQR